MDFWYGGSGGGPGVGDLLWFWLVCLPHRAVVLHLVAHTFSWSSGPLYLAAQGQSFRELIDTANKMTGS